MSRRHAAEKREVLPDAKFGDVVLSKFMNTLMSRGKKSVAERVVYGALDEIEAKLKEHGLDDWYYEDGWIRRKFNTDGWPTTLMLVNAVGYLCEAAWHHADLSVTWGKLWVKLTTHSSGGITDKDFALARKIDCRFENASVPRKALRGRRARWSGALATSAIRRRR